MKRLFTTLIVCLFAGIASASVEFGGVNYNLNSTTYTATIAKTDYSGDLVIPESIKVDGADYEVTEIEKYAFQGCPDLTSARLPKTIKTIGAYAFANGKVINIYIRNCY